MTFSMLESRYWAGLLLAVTFLLCGMPIFGAAEEGKAKTGGGEVKWQTNEREVAELEAFFKSRSIAMSKDGIREYLRRITRVEADRSDAKALIEQLRSGSFAERTAAEVALRKLPKIPMDLIKDAAGSDNPELALRAERILNVAVPDLWRTVGKTIRAVELLGFTGLAPEIMQVAELFQDEHQLDSIQRAILVTVTADDLALMDSLIEDKPNLRRIAIRSLAANNFAGIEGIRSRLDVVWQRGALLDRLASTEALLALGDRDVPGRFVKLMESDNAKVRAQAVRRLWAATGQYFSFDASGSSRKRAEQVAAWQAWVDESGATAKLQTESAFQTMWGRTLVGSYLHNDVTEYDLEGNETWRVKLEKVRKCWGLDSGERVAHASSALIVYAAGDGAVRELWRLDGRFRARPLADGDILVWDDDGSIRRYDRSGKMLGEVIVKKGWRKVPNDPRSIGGRSPFFLDILPDGNIRAIELIRGKYSASEIDKFGKVVRELPWDPDDYPRGRLENGNRLITIKGGVIERDPTGAVVWSYLLDGHSIEAAQRLPNGDTLVADRFSMVPGKLRIVRPDGKTIAWEMKMFGHVSDAYRY